MMELWQEMERKHSYREIEDICVGLGIVPMMDISFTFIDLVLTKILEKIRAGKVLP